MKKKQEDKKAENDRMNNDRMNKESQEKNTLPGEYPPNEDIMNRLNEVKRVSIDPNELSRQPSGIIGDGDLEDKATPSNHPIHTTSSKRSDLTKEDYEALGPRDLSMDGGDDEQLKHRVYPVDFGARDLDVPDGSTGKQDALDQGDEENGHYSLGGDDKDNLEEDPTRTFG